MILSLLIWYFIPLQLCSPHCTTCVYCLKHTCQIKEQLMHLIFNYCLLHHHAQWENVKASNPQYFKQQSVRCDHQALMHIQRHTDRNLNIEYEWEHFFSLSVLSWLFTLPFVTLKRIWHPMVLLARKMSLKLMFAYNTEKKITTKSLYIHWKIDDFLLYKIQLSKYIYLTQLLHFDRVLVCSQNIFFNKN